MRSPGGRGRRQRRSPSSLPPRLASLSSPCRHGRRGRRRRPSSAPWPGGDGVGRPAPRRGQRICRTRRHGRTLQADQTVSALAATSASRPVPSPRCRPRACGGVRSCASCSASSAALVVVVGGGFLAPRQIAIDEAEQRHARCGLRRAGPRRRGGGLSDGGAERDRAGRCGRLDDLLDARPGADRDRPCVKLWTEDGICSALDVPEDRQANSSSFGD